jgi:hypothetical protein
MVWTMLSLIQREMANQSQRLADGAPGPRSLSE